MPELTRALFASLLQQVLHYIEEDDNPELWDEAWTALELLEQQERAGGCQETEG